jgi:hypothetical protein
MKQWGARHDFTLGEGRLFSYSTGVQDDGTEEMLITGYGAPSRRQHPYFQRKGDELVSLTTQGPAHIASVEGIYDSRRDDYEVKFVETIPGSTVSTIPWQARPPQYETHELPGAPGDSYRWDLILGVGAQVEELHRRAARSSMATVVEFLPESSGALLIEAHRL